MSLQTFINSEATIMLCLNTRNYDERINRLKKLAILKSKKSTTKKQWGYPRCFLARFVKNKVEISDILNYRIGVEVVTEKNQKYNEIILPNLTYIQSHLEESWSLEQLSQKTGLLYYFHRMFQDAVGESLKNYTTWLKLEKATN